METKQTLMTALVALALCVPQGLKAAPPPQKVIQDASEQVRSILKKKVKKGSKAARTQKRRLKKIVDKFLDYHELSKRSLEYEEEEIGEDGTTASVIAVASTKNKKGKTVSEDLTFHLYLKTRKWMVYDVEFGDVSLVRHYRGEFNRKIKKESYAALIEAMKKKLDEIRSGKVKPGTKPKL
jgi:ABC-type transporter MlaC component